MSSGAPDNKRLNAAAAPFVPPGSTPPTASSPTTPHGPVPPQPQQPVKGHPNLNSHRPSAGGAAPAASMRPPYSNSAGFAATTVTTGVPMPPSAGGFAHHAVGPASGHNHHHHHHHAHHHAHHHGAQMGHGGHHMSHHHLGQQQSMPPHHSGAAPGPHVHPQGGHGGVTPLHHGGGGGGGYGPGTHYGSPQHHHHHHHHHNMMHHGAGGPPGHYPQQQSQQPYLPPGHMVHHSMHHHPHHGSHHHHHHNHHAPPHLQPQLHPSVAGGSGLGTPTSAGSPMLSKQPPVVVLVTGYHSTGKTTVAQKLAADMRYLYIDGREDNALAALEAKLEEHIKQRKPNQPCGFVLDDFITKSTAEYYYLVDILKTQNLKLDRVVYLESTLAVLGERREFGMTDRIEHPVAFEVCSTLLTGELSLFHVDCGARKFEEVYGEVLTEVRSIVPGQNNPPRSPPETLCAELPLVTDYKLFTEVRDAVHAACGGGKELYDFPGSVPCRAMIYSQFSRYYQQLQSYHLAYCYDGEQVLVVMHRGRVFVYPHTMCGIYEANVESRSFAEVAGAYTDEDPVTFVFDAVLAQLPSQNVSRVLLMDLVYFKGRRGSDMLWEERNFTIKDFMKNEGSDPFFIVSPTHKVHEIATFLERAEQSKIQVVGILFVHPGGYRVATYDQQNFLYRLPDCSSIDVRIWNGSIQDVQENAKTKTSMWVFQAMVLGDDGEEQTYGEVRVYLDDVAAQCLNDGNIIEVTSIPASAIPAPGGKGAAPGGKGAASVATKAGAAAAAGAGAGGAATAASGAAPLVFKYKSRRRWKIYPQSRFMIEHHKSWDKEALRLACATLPFKPLWKPQAAAAAPGGGSGGAFKASGSPTSTGSPLMPMPK